MAQVRPFRAVRYDEQRAGPLASLVAPPYDVLDAAARDRYLAASPHNVVHLTLADQEAEAAALWSAWLQEGILVRDDEAACWWLAQEYTGPDGVARTREGLVCALRAEPYEAGVVLPHERTHAGPKEGRLRLLRALRAQVEPIFLLYDGRLERPDGESVLEVELEGVRSTLWRLQGDPPERPCRRAAADRRRPPSLRDDARLPRRGGNRGERLAPRRHRPHGAGGPHDLPHAPDRRAPRAGRRRAVLRRRAAGRPLRGRHLPSEWHHGRDR